MVYVISKNGKPLMPCENVVARLLLKDKKAKVIKKCPFTIKLTYDSTEYTQPLTLGVDTGSSKIGTAVCDEKDNIVYTSQVEVRNDIKSKMDQRRMYRRNRRNRKTRYRKPRFLNRKNSTKNDRFSPTMISKFHSHIKEIEFIKSILPITQIVLETGTFDPHLMKNPILANDDVKRWGYQKGFSYGFANIKAAVLNRDNYTCQICKKNKSGIILEVHHKVFKSNGGSDEPENLVTLCENCHSKIHNSIITPKWKGKVSTLKHATQMNSIRTQLLRNYSDAIETFGYVTKENRLALGVDKDHYLDACVIASEGRKFDIKSNIIYKKSVAKGDYRRTMGVRSEKIIPIGKLFGFRKFDKVLYKGGEYFIKGRRTNGYFDLMNIDGVSQKFENPKTPKVTKMKRLSARKSIIMCVCK